MNDLLALETLFSSAAKRLTASTMSEIDEVSHRSHCNLPECLDIWGLAGIVGTCSSFRPYDRRALTPISEWLGVETSK